MNTEFNCVKRSYSPPCYISLLQNKVISSSTHQKTTITTITEQQKQKLGYKTKKPSFLVVKLRIEKCLCFLCFYFISTNTSSFVTAHRHTPSTVIPQPAMHPGPAVMSQYPPQAKPVFSVFGDGVSEPRIPPRKNEER